MERPEAQDNRQREQLLSEGHNPPRFVDRRLPTLEATIAGDGGPSKTAPTTQGTNPWVLGSLTIGSNHVFLVDYVKLETGSPNVWFKLRHNHPGSANPRGGTLDAFFLAAKGDKVLIGGPDQPLYAIRGPGTLFLYGFGAGSVSGTSSNRVHRALGTRAVDRFAGKVRGYIV